MEIDDDQTTDLAGPKSAPSNSSNKSGKNFDLTVLICTKNRAESLRQVLDCFVRERCDDIRFEVVVVDNGSSDNTQSVVSSYEGIINIRYLTEERPGKCHALNRGLKEAKLGEIVAILDDDLTLEPGWLRAVVDGCSRWPEHDLFSGRSHAILPEGESIPAWAHRIEFAGWAFSVNDAGTKDHEMRRGFFPSGNHFWVRSRVLDSQRRFPHLEILCEAGFNLGLYEDGYKGMWIGNVVVGHRVQPHLLDPNIVFRRMVQFGVESPYIRMPNLDLFWHARVFRDYPYVWVVLCSFNAIRWYAKYWCAFLKRDSNERFLHQIKSTVQLYNNLETVRHWRRIRQFVEDGLLRHPDQQTQEIGQGTHPPPS
ncbi:MAG: glycosyltransferase family 2 protein [Candidatus Hydrogenedentes bacterium]|nr:glycosyltransferase family 2 protein [Candidatus Hydrogenedentota bacterium]